MYLYTRYENSDLIQDMFITKPCNIIRVWVSDSSQDLECIMLIRPLLRHANIIHRVKDNAIEVTREYKGNRTYLKSKEILSNSEELLFDDEKITPGNNILEIGLQHCYSGLVLYSSGSPTEFSNCY